MKYCYMLKHINHKNDGNEKLIGFYSSWKKAKNIIKLYRSRLDGFKEQPNSFVIVEVIINKIYNCNLSRVEQKNLLSEARKNSEHTRISKRKYALWYYYEDDTIEEYAFLGIFESIHIASYIMNRVSGMENFRGEKNLYITPEDINESAWEEGYVTIKV